MKSTISIFLGLGGGAIATFFGGWNTGMVTLVICMIVDYATGLIVAGIFKKSTKTESGALESKAGWKGLCRKIVTILFVGIAYRLDITMGTTYIQDAVIIGFVANELLSIIENAGLMGVPIPQILTKAVEVLKNKELEEK